MSVMLCFITLLLITDIYAYCTETTLFLDFQKINSILFLKQNHLVRARLCCPFLPHLVFEHGPDTAHSFHTQSRGSLPTHGFISPVSPKQSKPPHSAGVL